MTTSSKCRHLVASCAVLLSVSCLAQTAKSEYRIKEDEPRTGSYIRRDTVRDSPIAINKRYSELSPEERAWLNQQYERIEPGDEPPFPREGLKPIFAAIGKAQAQLFVTGDLELVATVNAAGDVTEVTVIGSPSPEMTKFVASVLFETKFKPAICQRQPCRMQYPFQMRFGTD
jgi:hypothetical protein